MNELINEKKYLKSIKSTTKELSISYNLCLDTKKNLYQESLKVDLKES